MEGTSLSLNLSFAIWLILAKECSQKPKCATSKPCHQEDSCVHECPLCQPHEENTPQWGPLVQGSREACEANWAWSHAAYGRATPADPTVSCAYVVIISSYQVLGWFISQHFHGNNWVNCISERSHQVLLPILLPWKNTDTREVLTPHDDGSPMIKRAINKSCSSTKHKFQIALY